MVRFLGREEESGRIRLEYSGSKEGLEVEEKKGEVTADYVVVAVGGRPNYLKEDIC
jgi:pyruvate/2-oxoglutarate dehydrogenase complex dihydrolipoamide dehydrogenase (E3) component